jgi:hypothetical protein
VVAGRSPEEARVRPLARQVRLARTQAESAIARSLSEPQTRRIAADQSQAALGALRRLAQAAHLLRLEAQEAQDRQPQPALEPLVAGVDRLMEIIETTLTAGAQAAGVEPDWPDLRGDYLEFEHGAPRSAQRVALLSALDEIVDSANGLAAISGIEWVDGDPRPGRVPKLRGAVSRRRTTG